MAAEEIKNVENTEEKALSEKCETAECPKGPKKVWRILGWAFVGVVAVLLLAFIFRDFLIRQGVCRIGSLVVGTKVEMASFDTSLKGTVELKGLKVANPPGNVKPYAAEIDRVFIKVDTSTLATAEPVVEVFEVTGVRIDVEPKGLSESNLTDLQKNAERFAGAQKEKAKKKESDGRKGREVSPKVKKVAVSDIGVSVSFSAINTSQRISLLPFYWNSEAGAPLYDTLFGAYDNIMGQIKRIVDGVAGGIKAISGAGKSVGTGIRKGVSVIGDAGKSVGSGVHSVGKGMVDLFKKK